MIIPSYPINPIHISRWWEYCGKWWEWDGRCEGSSMGWYYQKMVGFTWFYRTYPVEMEVFIWKSWENPWDMGIPSKKHVTYSLRTWKWPIEIVSFPINSMVIFQYVMWQFTRGQSWTNLRCSKVFPGCFRLCSCHVFQFFNFFLGELLYAVVVKHSNWKSLHLVWWFPLRTKPAPIVDFH